MGKRLIIEGVDFSINAIDLSQVIDNLIPGVFDEDGIILNINGKRVSSENYYLKEEAVNLEVDLNVYKWTAALYDENKVGITIVQGWIEDTLNVLEVFDRQGKQNYYNKAMYIRFGFGYKDDSVLSPDYFTGKAKIR